MRHEGDSDICHFEGYPSSGLKVVADGEWRTASWSETISGTDLERGETKIGVIGFSLPDTETATSFELCGPTKDARVDYDRFACAPIKAPDRTAG
ncbi:hypothetical protein [Streptomyces sp. NBC_01353]|uniref:hypothetical protein n=1 Tax=Streptomyces sp. NBC_01353 TaxID=2903835 RepID=UPI002E2FE945|nr:hypothetical protein [Streptomyces sp. NBC_01353]